MIHMSKILHLVTLSGIKDVHLFLVDNPTFQWIVHGGPIPASTRQDILDSGNLCEDELDEWLAASWHGDNDRALIAPRVDSFDNALEFARYLSSSGTVVGETYEGSHY
jgi:hypothetical protein